MTIKITPSAVSIHVQQLLTPIYSCPWTHLGFSLCNLTMKGSGQNLKCKNGTHLHVVIPKSIEDDPGNSYDGSHIRKIISNQLRGLQRRR